MKGPRTRGSRAPGIWASLRGRYFCALLLVVLGVGYVLAESAPLLLNFQGRLTNSVGTPVTATTSVRFTLIQGGTATELTTSGTVVYQEDEDITPDSAGVFVHVIGSGTAVGGQTLEEADFVTNGPPLFVEMSIAAEPLLPRTQVLSAGYAIEASRLDGKSAAEIIGQAGGSAFVNEIVRHGATIEYVAATQIRVHPGVLGFSDAKVRKTSTELIWDLANGVAVLGLDAGTAAANTWYYLYAVPDPAGDAKFTAVASVNAPIQVGESGPAGYGLHRFLGSFRIGSSLQVVTFFRSGDLVSWGGHAEAWLSHSGAEATVNAWVTVDASTAQPLTSAMVVLDGRYDAWGSNTALQYYVGSGPASPTRNYYFCTDWGDGAANCNQTVPTVNRMFSYRANTYSWSNNSADQTRSFYYTGYTEDLARF